VRVATDIGGTFTDLVYFDEKGKLAFKKTHTTIPNFEEGVINVLKESNVNLDSISNFVHGSTVVINTLTERKGAKVGLICTKGTRDVLEIARSNRPDLYNFKYEKPKPFVERYLRKEVNERLNYKGEIIKEVDRNEIIDIVNYFIKEGVESIAVCFLHSYINHINEKTVLEIINDEFPEIDVSASYELIQEWREYERTNTTVLNSYVKPLTKTYINSLDEKLDEHIHDNNRFIMQSNGGLNSFNDTKRLPINMVESGPVGGILGAEVLGGLIGEKNIIAFDIGGTTAKCSLIHEGKVNITTDYYIKKNEVSSGYPIKVPVIDIVEIGNGGGSIAKVDQLGSLKVGPESAGSNPGPISYGNGGTKVTTTDANLYLGRLSTSNFDNSVDIQKVKLSIKEQVSDIYNSTVEEGAMGIIGIANSNMLNALKLISVRKGYNPEDFTLVAFGGGGPMHAAELAKDLGVKKIVIPYAASVFSAWGMVMSDARKDYIQTYLTNLENLDFTRVNNKWKELKEKSIKEFEGSNLGHLSLKYEKHIDLRYKGQEHTVKMKIKDSEWDDKFIEEIKENFNHLHEFTYSFKLDNTEIELVNMHLTAIGKVEDIIIPKISMKPIVLENALKEVREVYFENSGWQETRVYNRDLLNEGHEINGPAIIEEKTSSTLILKDQIASIDNYGNIIIKL